MTVTDEKLIAYIDGELTAQEAAEVEAAARDDPELAALISAHRGLSAAVKDAYAEVVEEPVPERLLAAAQAGRVVSLDAVRARRAVPAPVWLRWASIAAALVAGVAVGVGIPREGGLIGGDMQARGQLASALDSQLASTQPDKALVRVGLSFKARDGGYCRTFSVAEGGPAGLACRKGGGWAVQMAVARPAGGETEFRTAASDTPAEILAAAQALMADSPLDAEGEKAARKAGWK